MDTASVSQTDWLQALVKRQSKAAELFGRLEPEQKRRGYFHTLHEICQQPWTWLRTCDRLISFQKPLRASLEGVRCLVLTGSGSSEYAGECVSSALQNDLAVWTQSIGGGTLLAHRGGVLPFGRPGMLVSVARSGDSPESRAAVELLMEEEPGFRHIVVTCNEAGGLATAWNGSGKVLVITLPKETNDQSLVMTSSFTNLLLAVRFLGMLHRPQEYRELVSRLGCIASELIQSRFDALAKAAVLDFRRVVYLSSAANSGACREAALKMLEMTAGRVTALSETYLGFRHGPMSFAHDDTLLVCFLSSKPSLRAYELDLMRELDRKKLGLCKLIVGEAVPGDVVRDGDVVIECPGLSQIADEDTAAIHVVAAQLLAFFRCLHEGFRPDSPSEDGVISRVVASFPLHTSPEA